MQYSLNEITLLPSYMPTDISSRSQVNPFTEDGNLPIFVAPMTSVVDENNYQKFIDNKVIPILPRNCIDTRDQKDIWHSYSLQEFEAIVNSPRDYNGYHILIDIANGHIQKLYDLVKTAKSKWPGIIIMVGNIAHPALYQYCCQARVDYVRVGIGGGSVCSTSVQTSIHASHQWMIEGIKKIKRKMYEDARPIGSSTTPNIFLTKVIADGGINRLDKAIKCLALGYDYVMMGKCFAECEEACGETAIFDSGKHRKYYGMASTAGQIALSGRATKNPEGIETWIPVTNTLPKFTAQFEAALRSTMSYVGAHNLDELRNNTQYDIQSIEEFKSYYK